MEGIQKDITRKIWFYVRTILHDWRFLLALGLVFLTIYVAVCYLITRTFILPYGDCRYAAL